MRNSNVVNIVVATILAALISLHANGEDQQPHEWVSDSGSRINAKYVGTEYDSQIKAVVVRLIRESDGKEVRVPLQRLSDESKDLAQRIAAESMGKEKKLGAEKNSRAT